MNELPTRSSRTEKLYPPNRAEATATDSAQAEFGLVGGGAFGAGGAAEGAVLAGHFEMPGAGEQVLDRQDLQARELAQASVS